MESDFKEKYINPFTDFLKIIKYTGLTSTQIEALKNNIK